MKQAVQHPFQCSNTHFRPKMTYFFTKTAQLTEIIILIQNKSIFSRQNAKKWFLAFWAKKGSFSNFRSKSKTSPSYLFFLYFSIKNNKKNKKSQKLQCAIADGDRRETKRYEGEVIGPNSPSGHRSKNIFWSWKMYFWAEICVCNFAKIGIFPKIPGGSCEPKMFFIKSCKIFIPTNLLNLWGPKF